MRFLLCVARENDNSFDCYRDDRMEEKDREVLDYMGIRMLCSNNGLEEPTTTEMKHLAAGHCNFIVDFVENSVNQLKYAE